jgi:hypothetical protein
MNIHGALLGGLLTLAACGPEPQDFPDDEELLDLRILAIRADPPDLVPGETVVLTPLVYVPPNETATYQWELCLIHRGPDGGFECANDELGLPEEFLALLDLGSEEQAELAYFLDPEELRERCQEALAAVDFLPDFVGLPSCDSGLPLTVRLVVRTESKERIGIRDLFFWFTEPDPLQRNANPQIAAFRVGATDIAGLPFLAAAPKGRLQLRVEVDESERQAFLPRSQPEGEVDEEILVYSWFSTHGDLDRDRSFADGESFTVGAAGANHVDFAETAGAEGEVIAVVRDRRGGVDWVRAQIRFIAPAGGLPLP